MRSKTPAFKSSVQKTTVMSSTDTSIRHKDNVEMYFFLARQFKFLGQNTTLPCAEVPSLFFHVRMNTNERSDAETV